jgi:Carboxypeptidase regulatory-like domain
MTKAARVTVWLVLASISATLLLAQDKKKNKEDAGTRIVQGIVAGPDDKPVPGAVVLLKDMRTLQVRSFIAQDGGTYHFSGLKTDNDYELKADSSGLTSGWKKLSVFDSRKEPVINLKLEKK